MAKAKSLQRKTEQLIRVHLGDIEYYFESYEFYKSRGYTPFEPRYIRKTLT